jgi:light-harvesting complex 1 beta chain
MSSFMAFVAVAVVAHILAWIWRPWLPTVRGYTSCLHDCGQGTLAMLGQLIG